jgi:hypothetical protein
VANAASVFDVDGRVVDPETRRRVRLFVEGFAAFAGAHRRVDHRPIATIAAEEAR